MSGIDAKRDERFGLENPIDFEHMVRYQFGHLLVVFGADDNRKVEPTCNRIYLADALHIGKRFRHGIHLAVFDIQKNQCSNQCGPPRNRIILLYQIHLLRYNLFIMNTLDQELRYRQ